MPHQGELYAERLRRETQAAALASGQTQWTEQLDRDVRVKLAVAWDDVTQHMAFQHYLGAIEELIARRTLRAIAYTLDPRIMQPGSNATNEQLLTLIEAEHDALTLVADGAAANPAGVVWLDVLTSAPETFRQDVNRILAAHIVAFSLHQNGELVPIDSHEMHDAVVAPTLYLLHSQPRFAAAESAYQNALKELRNRDAPDAITDAGTALQDTLTALGCAGNNLTDLLKSAKDIGLVRENESPLIDTLPNVVRWAARQRNAGEAHRGDADSRMSDAWMVVHVVGALIIRLTEADAATP